MNILPREEGLSSVLGRAIGGYAGGQLRDVVQKRKQSQLQQALNKFMSSEEYKSMPLSQKATITSARFGPEASKALIEGEKIDQRQQEQRAEYAKNIGLQNLIQQSDFSSPEGQRDFLAKSAQLGIKPADATKIMGELRPSMLNQFLGGFAPYQQEGSQPQAVKEQAPIQQEAIPDEMRPQQRQAPVDAGIHPAVKDTPYNQIPDSALALASSSTDRELSNFGNAVLELRNREYKRFSDDRKYHTARAKKYADDMVELRKTMPAKEAALQAITHAINTGNLGMATRDWWADRLGAVGKGMVTPEGALLKTAVKEFLISDLSRLTGRPNQFIEQRILSMLPQIGQTDEANLMMSLFLGNLSDLEKEKLSVYDDLSEQYERENGFVPGNIDSLVSKKMQPFAENLQNKLAYKTRVLQERNTGLKNIYKKAVAPGTPLTVEMARFLIKKHGREKAEKIAKQKGYLIPTAEQYRGYR